jgi:hypothetical protein
MQLTAQAGMPSHLLRQLVVMCSSIARHHLSRKLVDQERPGQAILFHSQMVSGSGRA